MKAKYPKYRVSSWIDTSEESMAKENADIVYGVQTQRHKGGPWMHVAKGEEPMFFDTADKASSACDTLRRKDAEAAIEA